MEIKNFLSLVFIISLAAGCQSIERRHENQPYPVKVEPGQAEPAPQAPMTHPSPPDASVPQLPPQVKSPAPGQLLPVGVYLGPGAVRAFAHIGVLRALQRAQVPIVAIGGMEWGSIIAASYALSKGANEVEWEMMKLKRDDWPTTSLLHRQLAAMDIQSLFDFLNLAFGSKDLASGSIPFRCPTTDGQDTVFISKGKAREELLRCAALPPLYNFYDRAGRRWVSGAVSPGDWPGELRKLGAQFIIYVDVISHGRLLAPGKYNNEQQLKALWFAIRAISKQQHLFANMTIEVPSEIDLTDFDRRHEATALGERAAASDVNDIIRDIGVH